MISKRAAVAVFMAITVCVPVHAAAVSAAGVPAHSEMTLYRFNGGSDGRGPYGAVSVDQNGNLFGTTIQGGDACTKEKHGCGTVFELAADGTETVLYAFRGGRDGTSPASALVADQQGNLYGTTPGGGSKACFQGCGTVFEVTQQGTHTITYDFKGGSDGWRPAGPLIIDKAGNLYGTTFYGGIDKCDGECGTVFALTPEGVHTVLYSFRGGSDGAGPAALAVDAAGNFYGTTAYGGGKRCGNGCGTVYKLAPNGTETVLYAFHGGLDGIDPKGGLMVDAAGDLYGTTEAGGGTGCGGTGCGTVFEIAPGGRETVLSRFNHAGGPAKPFGGVVMDDAGTLFGTTFEGGPADCGTVFKLVPGSGAKAIYSFTCGRDGGYPYAGLLQAPSGTLYGTATSYGNRNGTVFAIQK